VKQVKTGKSLLCLVCSMALLSLPMTVCAWEPNARDRDAAINAGNFTAYSGQITAWLKQKVPANPAQITKEKMIALLRDPVFVGALAERQFIGKVWDQPDLGGYAKADPKNRAFVAWVMSNGKLMDEVMLTRTPTDMAARYDNSWSINAGVLENWKKIYYAYPESREGLYLRLAVACALRPPGTGNVGAGACISFGHFSLFFLGCGGISVIAYDKARHEKRGPATDGEAPGGSPEKVGRGGRVCSGVRGPDEAALCPARLPPLPRGRPSSHLGADGQPRRQDLDGVPRLRPLGRGSAFERELPAVPGLGRGDRRREPGPLDRSHTVC